MSGDADLRCVASISPSGPRHLSLQFMGALLAEDSQLNSFPNIASVQKRLNAPETSPLPRGSQNSRLINERHKD